MPPEWRIRRASPADLEAVLALEESCAEAPHWSHASWLAALSQQQESEPVRFSVLAEANSGILGFAVASYASALAELESVMVSRQSRRQGIGKALCRRVIDWSLEVGAREIELEVRASSDAALALYRSQGFVEQGRRRHYYRDPTEDAVLMIAQL